jgi:hypothetical protein
MTLIRVKNRDVVAWATIDDDDVHLVQGFAWHLNLGYATASVARKTIYMHRLILGLEHGNPLQCDHINRDRLDNRRSNLRAVPQARNLRNLGSKSGSTSQYRGVWWRRERGKWGAQAKLEDVAYHLGTFANEDDAARAVNEFWVSHGYDAPNVILDRPAAA